MAIFDSDIFDTNIFDTGVSGGIGESSNNLGAINLNSSSKNLIRATSTSTLGSIGSSSSSTILVRASSSNSINAVIVGTTSKLSINGALSNNIEVVNVSSEVEELLPNFGYADISTSIALSSSAGLNIKGTLSTNLVEILSSSASKIAITGQSIPSINDITSLGTSTISTKGTVSTSIDSITNNSVASISIASESFTSLEDISLISEVKEIKALESLITIDFISADSTSQIKINGFANSLIEVTNNSTSSISIEGQSNSVTFVTSEGLGRLFIASEANGLIGPIISAGNGYRNPYVYSETSGNNPNFQTSGGPSDWPYGFSTFTPSDDPYRS